MRSPQRPHRPNALFSLVAFGAAILLTACGSTANAETPRAVLDEDRQLITLPLDAYVMSDRDIRMVDHANQLAVGDCLSESGIENPGSELDWTAVADTHNRMFGPWNLDWVAIHAYDYPPDPLVAAVLEEQNSLGPQWIDAFERCANQINAIPTISMTHDPNLASQGFAESYAAAEARPEWSSAIGDWRVCLSQQGYDVAEGDWVPDMPSGLEAQIQVAIADVECKQETGLVQRLSDLLAAEQASFTQENESALEALRADRDEALQAARDRIGV